MAKVYARFLCITRRIGLLGIYIYLVAILLCKTIFFFFQFLCSFNVNLNSKLRNIFKIILYFLDLPIHPSA